MVILIKYIILYSDSTWAIGGDTYEEAMEVILQYEGEKNGAVILNPAEMEGHKLLFDYDNIPTASIKILD
jgi:hypothetical protein